MKDGFYHLASKDNGREIILCGFYKDRLISSLPIAKEQSLDFAQKIEAYARASDEEIIYLAPVSLPRIESNGKITLGLSLVTVFNRGAPLFLIHFLGPRGGSLEPIKLRNKEALLEWSLEIKDLARN